MKSGFQKYAAENEVIVIIPDTSPRDIGDLGFKDDWRIGYGAGMYANATKGIFAKNF